MCIYHIFLDRISRFLFFRSKASSMWFLIILLFVFCFTNQLTSQTAPTTKKHHDHRNTPNHHDHHVQLSTMTTMTTLYTKTTYLTSLTPLLPPDHPSQLDNPQHLDHPEHPDWSKEYHEDRFRIRNVFYEILCHLLYLCGKSTTLGNRHRKWYFECFSKTYMKKDLVPFFLIPLIFSNCLGTN